MNKIFLSFLLAVSIESSFSQTTVVDNYIPFVYVGPTNPISISNGLIRPQTYADAQTLRIDATKINLAQIQWGTYAPENTAVLNVHTTHDGVDLVKFRTLYSNSYFKMTQQSGNYFTADFVQNNVSQLFLNTNGSIGINTNTPNSGSKLHVNGNIYASDQISIGEPDFSKITPYKLAVNGTAIFTKVKIKLNTTTAPWPDYVFDEMYNLLPLPELEKFLKENKHLPEVPTAAAVEQDGIDIGSTQTILLQKIEELTLYAIEQNKKATAQQEQINTLLKELAALKEQQKK